MSAYEMRISDWSSDVCSSDLRNIVCEMKMSPDPDQKRAFVNHMLDDGYKVFSYPEDYNGASIALRVKIRSYGIADPAVWLEKVKQPVDMSRSEERRVGKECVRSGSSRCSPYH